MAGIVLYDVIEEKMKFPSMFKTPSYRSFNFKPRYYDADKEAFEERIKQIKLQGATSSNEVEAAKNRVRNHFQNKRKSHTLNSSKNRNIRLLVIISLLTALSYWILK